MSQKKDRHEQETLVLATDPGVNLGVIQPVEAVAELEDYLRSFVGLPVRVVFSKNYEEILKGLENGSIDAARLGPYAFALAQARSGVRALVNMVDNKVPDGERLTPYRSLICTREDSGITYLAQLKERKFGFVDRQSTSGYLVATFLLQQAGLDAMIDLEPVFLHSHRAVAEAVSNGDVLAGAVMEAEFLRFREQVPSPALLLLATSPLLSRGPIAIRPDLSPLLARKLTSALEQLHAVNTEYARLLVPSTRRFVAAPQRERTLKTIAELAGVSYATVSRAINGRDRIAPETSARILKLVEELGYQPNANARSLHKQRGDLVTLLLPTLEYPYLDEIVAGIQEILSEANMQLLICSVGRGKHEQLQERQKAYIELLSNSSFAGTLFTQWSARDPLSMELVRSGHPSVLLEQDLLEVGVRTLWQWVHRQGYRRMILVTGKNASFEPTSLRLACQHLPDIQLQSLALDTTQLNWQDTIDIDPLESMVLLCTDDETALHVRAATKKSGGQVLVIGIGNSPLARWSGLSSLAYDGVALGRVAAKRLLRVLNMPVQAEHESVRFWMETKAER